jgi:hypothetical protein
MFTHSFVLTTYSVGLGCKLAQCYEAHGVGRPSTCIRLDAWPILGPLAHTNATHLFIKTCLEGEKQDVHSPTVVQDHLGSHLGISLKNQPHIDECQVFYVEANISIASIPSHN